MLNFIYYPISAILWFWHQAMGLIMDPASGISWVLAIILLVATIRILLFRPMMKQQRSAMKMQKMQPRMQEIRAKYKNDQQQQAMEMRKLQKEMGVNPLAGCLPMLVQIPVFLGLFHVLRSFNRTGEGAGSVGQSSMTVEENWNTGNYFFGVEDVRSFLLARIGNSPLAASIMMDESQKAAFSAPDAASNFTRTDVMVIAIPLMILSAAMIHFNARMSINRTKRRQESGLQQKQEGMMGTQMDMMNRMMLWFMPLIILATGAIWTVGLLVYMVFNNVWTYFQQRYIFSRLDREEEAEVEAERLAKQTAQQKLAPKVGARPVNPKKGGKARKGAGHKTVDENVTEADADAQSTDSGATAVETADTATATETDHIPSKPAPGQRPANPKKRKKKKR